MKQNINNIYSGITIREAVLADEDIIVNFNLALALETEKRVLDKEILQKSIRAILQDRHKGVYLLACIEDKIVGQIMYVYEWSTWRNANFMWITDLYVLPEYRKKGIFTVISRYVMQLYHHDPGSIGLRFYVDKSNTSVIPLYKKAGWKESNYDLWEIKKDGCQ